MTKVYIIYRSFFDMEGNEYTVGGIQTYIRQLINVIKKNNLQPVIVQFANCYFEQKYDDIDVFGINVKSIKKERAKSKKLLEFINKKIEAEDIIIFGSDDIFVPTSIKRTLVIQHGITWDIPKYKYKYFITNILRKTISTYRHLIYTKKAKNMVCVDYNYVNWLRTQICKVEKNLFVIPNCTEINKNLRCISKKNRECIKIIFARRFETYRGTRLFSEAIITILKKYNNINITFAGKGPEEDYLKTLFKDDPRVSFITYRSEESLKIHEEHDIAIIPTLGSEGTSLSLLEAMASKCAVIATNVGGMTNIILDNYNGILIQPNKNMLIKSIEKLITDHDFRASISENAYQSVSQAFSKDLWDKRWSDVIKFIMSEN